MPCELHNPAGTFHQLPNGAQTTLKRHSPPPGLDPPLCPGLSHALPGALPGAGWDQCWDGLTGLPWTHPTSTPLVWTPQALQINEPSKPCQAGDTNAGKPEKVDESGFNYYLPLSSRHTLYSCAQEPQFVFQILQEWGFSEPPHRAAALISTSMSDPISSEHVLSGRSQTQPWKQEIRRKEGGRWGWVVQRMAQIAPGVCGAPPAQYSSSTVTQVTVTSDFGDSTG